MGFEAFIPKLPFFRRSPRSEPVDRVIGKEKPEWYNKRS